MKVERTEEVADIPYHGLSHRDLEHVVKRDRLEMKLAAPLGLFESS